jgi:hypothetical protein
MGVEEFAHGGCVAQAVMNRRWHVQIMVDIAGLEDDLQYRLLAKIAEAGDDAGGMSAVRLGARADDVMAPGGDGLRHAFLS